MEQETGRKVDGEDTSATPYLPEITDCAGLGVDDLANWLTAQLEKEGYSLEQAHDCAEEIRQQWLLGKDFQALTKADLDRMFPTRMGLCRALGRIIQAQQLLQAATALGHRLAASETLTEEVETWEMWIPYDALTTKTTLYKEMARRNLKGTLARCCRGEGDEEYSTRIEAHGQLQQLTRFYRFVKDWMCDKGIRGGMSMGPTAAVFDTLEILPSVDHRAGSSGGAGFQVRTFSSSSVGSSRSSTDKMISSLVGGSTPTHMVNFFTSALRNYVLGSPDAIRVVRVTSFNDPEQPVILELANINVTLDEFTADAIAMLRWDVDICEVEILREEADGRMSFLGTARGIKDGDSLTIRQKAPTSL